MYYTNKLEILGRHADRVDTETEAEIPDPFLIETTVFFVGTAYL